MSFDETMKSELEAILATMGTDAFDTEAKQRLGVFVSQSEEARRIYVEHCQMQAMLRQSSLLATFSSEQLPSAAVQPSRSRWPFMKWTGLAVAACAVFVIGLNVSLYFRDDSSVGVEAMTARIACVESLVGSAYFEDSELTKGAEISRGVIRVESGAMNIQFVNGTAMLIEGPAELFMDSDMQVSLIHGKVAASVSEDAHGFTVLGADLAVVDLGTEFAMAIQDGESWVEVYEGEVDIALLDKDGHAWKSRQLTTSDVVRIDASVGKIIDETPPIDLPRFSEPSLDGLDVPTAYTAAVMNSAAAHYWKFDEAEGDRIADIAGNATAVLMDGARLHNGSLYFPRGRRNHGFAFVAEPVSSLLNDEFTIEVWMKPSFSQRSTLLEISHRNPASKFREKLYRLALLPPQGTVYPGETVRFFGQLWPYGEQEAVSAFSADRYRPGTWHHVVAVRRHDRLELYFDGKPANSVPAPLLTSDSLPATITIGRFSGPQQAGSKPDRAFFKGLVDEVAIYPSALSTEEVANHYRLMRVK